MARIENHKYSIEEAFRECFYIVPDYQREYVWTDKEVHQLLEDIGEQIDAGTTREYFIGTVLVSPTDQKNHYEVIDGQQRLTTSTLLIESQPPSASASSTMAPVSSSRPASPRPSRRRSRSSAVPTARSGWPARCRGDCGCCAGP
jgi:hypothetical protein